MTVYLTFEQVLAIHNYVEPDPTILDAGAIQSALARPQATAFGSDAYPGIWEKAAALLHSLACNHGWLDGKKRTAWTVTMTFLDVNGHPLDPGFDELAAEEFVVAIADGRFRDVHQIAAELPKYAS